MDRKLDRMLFAWKENNTTTSELVSASEYMDQVEWTSLARLREDPDLDRSPIGIVPLRHENFSRIMDAVLSRSPETKFHLWEAFDFDGGFGTDRVSSAGGPVLLSDYGGAACPGTNGAEPHEAAMANTVSLYLGIVAQAVVGSSGMVGNCMAMHVLIKSRKLRSSFNAVLTCNLLLHTLFIVTSLAIEAYRHVDATSSALAFLHVLFSHLLYPMKPLLMHASTILAVVMARERYRAIKQPIEYRRRQSLSSDGPWRKAVLTTLAAVVASAFFVMPLLWETHITRKETTLSRAFNDTHMLETLVVRHEVNVTDFRLAYHYVLWYKNLATFFLTLFVPLVLLAYWNVGTYLLLRERAIRQRVRAEGSIAPHVDDDHVTELGSELAASHVSALAVATLGMNSRASVGSACGARLAAHWQDEERKARILFAVVGIFLVCHTLRFVLNAEECWAQRDYRFATERNCSIHPAWALVVNHCSQLLICVNASVGFLVYCVMSTDFRAELRLRCCSGRHGPCEGLGHHV